MKIPARNLPPKRHLPIVVLSIVGAIFAGLFALRRKVPAIGAALRNKYLLFVGVFGALGAVLFGVFRAIRFLIKLYP